MKTVLAKRRWALWLATAVSAYIVVTDTGVSPVGFLFYNLD
jgi:hypothetical protein